MIMSAEMELVMGVDYDTTQALVMAMKRRWSDHVGRHHHSYQIRLCIYKIRLPILSAFICTCSLP